MDVQILILNISQNISKYLTEKTVENLDNVDNIDKFVNLDNVDTADSVDTFHITWAQIFFIDFLADLDNFKKINFRVVSIFLDRPLPPSPDQFQEISHRPKILLSIFSLNCIILGKPIFNFFVFSTPLHHPTPDQIQEILPRPQIEEKKLGSVFFNFLHRATRDADRKEIRKYHKDDGGYLWTDDGGIYGRTDRYG